MTAHARPNPSVSFSPSYDTQIPNNPSPWIIPVTFDIPLETAGKRAKRIAEAEKAAESARWSFVSAAWQIRSGVRAALLDFSLAGRRAELLQKQFAAQSEIVKLLQQRFDAGSISRPELTVAHIALDQTQLALSAARTQQADARSRLAQALGLSLAALDGVKLAYDFSVTVPATFTTTDARSVALRGRADVLGALADYAAAEADLRLQIAKQYPDLHLGPGYAWNNGNASDNQWTLGATLELPILDQNQGPIAEARARRELAAAKFIALQAQVSGTIDRAMADLAAARRTNADRRFIAGRRRAPGKIHRPASASRRRRPAGSGERADGVEHRPARATGQRGAIAGRRRRAGGCAAKSVGPTRRRHRKTRLRKSERKEAMKMISVAADASRRKLGFRNFSWNLRTAAAANAGLNPILILLAVACFALAGCSKTDADKSDAAPAEDAATPSVVSVQTGALKLATLHRYIQGYGTVEPAPATAEQPAASAQLAAPSAGVVTKVNVVEGQRVNQGDVLAELNSGTTTAENAAQQVERQKQLYAQQNTSLKNLQDAEAQLALLRVTAPLSGTVVRVNVKPGQAVDLTTVVAEVMDLNRLVVSVGIPAAAAGELNVGEQVQVLTEPPVNTALSYVSPAVDKNNDTVLVRALLPADSGLRPGQFVPLRIVTAVHTNCLAAPDESVVTDDGGKSVLALVHGDEAAQTPVQTGLKEGGWVEVSAPELKAGDVVVTVGAYGLPEKTKVQIRK